ncbi:MAG TPA: MFS transporter [Firmicutes bacterium]|nr:MFS transporter [Bacillota bacterium]
MSLSKNRSRRYSSLIGMAVLWFLAIEFVDELVDGYLSAAWPAIKSDLSLTLTQIGLLTGLPRLTGNIIEIPLGFLADRISRRLLIAMGGLAFALATLIISISPGFALLLAGFILFYPASGAFVSISQASLMDLAPDERELNMARWSLSGTLANLAGPLLFGAAVAIGAGWRPAYGLIAVFSLILTFRLLVKKTGFAIPAGSTGSDVPAGGAFLAGDDTPEKVASPPAGWNFIMKSRVWRWLLLLESSDLLMDIFRGFLALYLVEIAGTDPAFAALAVGVHIVGCLVGGTILLPLLRRVSGTLLIRISSLVALAIYPLFILISSPGLKLCPLFILGLLTAGWYSILKAGLYAEMPGQSGSAMALSSAAGMIGGLFPIGLGAVADLFGLQTTMWLLLLAPVSLLLGMPRPLVPPTPPASPLPPEPPGRHKTNPA